MSNPIKWFLYKIKRAYYWYVQEPKIEKERVKLRERLNDSYEEWITAVEAGYDKVDCSGLKYQPKISILVPVYNVLDKHLIPCIESVLEQEYTNWELCLADDCSTWDNVRTTLKKYESNPQIKIAYREKNGHISECTNSALEMATGEFIAFLDCDDVLAPNALSEVVKLLNENPKLDFIYSDEDKIDDDGKKRHMPNFKPDWSPDTFMSFMYTCHFSVYRKSIVDEIGGLRKGFEGAQDYDFTLRFTEKTDSIGHIPKVLYHWRERDESTAKKANVKPYVLDAAKRSKEDAMKRRGIDADIELLEFDYQYRVNYKLSSYPKVSIIIPSKDNYDVLKRCVETLYQITDYCDFEVIVVDNGSNEDNQVLYQRLTEKFNAQYIYEKKDFNFSYMCNLGVHNAQGEYILLLNDDVEIIQKDWLARMVGQATLSHTGAVGAKLLYPNNKAIQHVGVVVNSDGPIHMLCGLSDEYTHDFFRNTCVYNYLAVTGACLLVKKEKYEAVNGLFEGLPVAYNDVDFCFKLYKQGYYNVVRNDAVLIHHESVSRGYDYLDETKMKRLYREKEILFSRHPQFKTNDPFYNVNLANYGMGSFSAFDNEELKLPCNNVYEINELSYAEKNVIYTIDEIKENKYAYGVRGWMIITDEPMSEFWETFVILTEVNTDKMYKCESRIEQRIDVKDAMVQYGIFEFAGFNCRIEKDIIPKGEYVVSLCKGKSVVKTESKIRIS